VVRKAAFTKLATGLQKLTGALGVPVSFLQVGATETYNASTGAVTRTGGETVTVSAVATDASESSIAAGLAKRGDLMVIVEARLLRTLLGAAFEPARGGAITANGQTLSIIEIRSTRDGDAAATHFELLVRA
jgi:hypothetical protein